MEEDKCYKFKCIVTSTAQMYVWAKNYEEAEERLACMDWDDCDIYQNDILELCDIESCEVE